MRKCNIFTRLKVNTIVSRSLHTFVLAAMRKCNVFTRLKLNTIVSRSLHTFVLAAMRKCNVFTRLKVNTIVSRSLHTFGKAAHVPRSKAKCVQTSSSVQTFHRELALNTACNYAISFTVF